MKNILLLFSLFFLQSQIFGQSANFPDPDEIILSHVYAVKDFSKPDGWIRISNDNGSALSGSSATEVWSVSGNIKPAGYVSGSVSYFGADFTLNCNGDDLYVRGESINGKHLPIKKLTPWTGSSYRYTKAPLSNYSNNAYTDYSFENEKVKYWKEFEIIWFVSNDPDLPHNEWVSLGESIHPLYVTHKKPIVGDNPLDANDGDTEILLTSIHTACSAGNNSNFESQIVTLIYDKFTNLCVKRVNNKAEEIDNCLGYWQPSTDGPCATVSAFLINGNARCNEWADFFNDMLKIQGIQSSKVTSIEYTENHLITEEIENDLLSAIEVNFNTCLVQMIDITETAIFVKEFDFTSDLIYLDEFAPGPPLELCNGTILTNPNKDGIPAQGVNNNNPQSVFYDHVIVEYNGYYFDPSYGSEPKVSKISYEDSAFAGFGAIPYLIYEASDGIMYDEVFLYLDERNTQGDQQLIFNP